MNKFQKQLYLKRIDSKMKDFLALRQQLIEQAKIEVNDNDSYNLACYLLTQVNKLIKEADKKKKEMLKPLNELRNLINSRVKSYFSELERVSADLKRKIADYTTALELKRKEAEKKMEEERKRLQQQLEEEAKQKGIEPVKLPEMALPAQKQKVQTEYGTVYQAEEWTFELVDFSQVPDEYKQLDRAKINYAIKRQGIREIRGLKILKKTNIRVRRS